MSRARHTLLDWTNSYKRTCCETPRDFVRASTALKINLAIGGESFSSIFFFPFFFLFFSKKKKSIFIRLELAEHARAHTRARVTIGVYESMLLR